MKLSRHPSTESGGGSHCDDKSCAAIAVEGVKPFVQVERWKGRETERSSQKELEMISERCFHFEFDVL